MVDAIAAASTSIAQSQVQSAVAVKVLKIANDQQQSVASLLEGAMEVAQQTQQMNAAGGVDTYA